jgi:hypothetical protein
MLEFVNDPQFDGLPLVGEGHVLVARRTECGRAARWVPGGSVVALAEFLGPEFPVLDNRLYERQLGGALMPLDLNWPMWVFVPPAGEPVMFRPESLTPQYAQVVDSAQYAQVPDPRAAAVKAEGLTDEVKAAKSLSKAAKAAAAKEASGG